MDSCSELPCRAAGYIQLAQHSCYNSFIDTDSGADMTGNTSGKSRGRLASQSEPSRVE